MGKTATVPASDPAQVGAQWVDKFGRVRTPRAYLYDDYDNLVAVGQQAIAATLPPRRQRGHSARPATNQRVRGSRRSTVRRSSERSGDSGSDSESSEPPPRRLCAFCGKDIPANRSPRATHCSDRHADRDRQRRKRQRDRARSKLPPTPTTADFRRMLEITDEERDWLRALVVCRCNGRHLEFDPGECFRCGHTLPREQVAA